MTSGIVGMHLTPFEIERRRLRSQCDLVTHTDRYLATDDIAKCVREPVDIVLFTATWRAELSQLQSACEEMRRNGARRIVYFDTFDQSSSSLFGLLPHVDLYVKSKMLKPVSAYQRSHVGGFVFAEFCEKQLGIATNGWYFGSIPDVKYADRIVPGWNFGAGRRCRTLLSIARWVQRPLSRRPIHLHARVTPPKAVVQEWYGEYRRMAAEIVSGLPRKIVVTPVGRVTPFQFVKELLASRCVFSPFGWGEVCVRDYEAVACGCLLIKPDMGHLETSPNIFEPDVTYVPVKWDLSDLSEVCERVLSDPDSAQRIATTAQHRLATYYRGGGFVENVGSILSALGLAGGSGEPMDCRRDSGVVA